MKKRFYNIDPRRNIFDLKNGFEGFTLTCDNILAYNNSEGSNSSK
jgi:hypothetical protein